MGRSTLYRLGWVDAYENSKLVPRYASSGSDVYSGSSGIAMFLAAHYQYSQDRQHLRAIEGAVNQPSRSKIN